MTPEEIEKILEAIDSAYDIITDIISTLEDELFCGDEEREQDALNAICILGLCDMNTHRKMGLLMKRLSEDHPRLSVKAIAEKKKGNSEPQTIQIKTNPLKS